MSDRASLRVGLNLFPLIWRGGGMRQYALQLLPWLLRLSSHEFHIFHGPSAVGSLATIIPCLPWSERRRLTLVPIDTQEEIYRHAHTFDLFFCPLNNFAPRLLDRPTLATLADVQEQFFPEYFTAEQLRERRVAYPQMANAVTLLLTISEYSKETICDAFGIDRDKVRVTYLAPSEDLFQATPRWPNERKPLPERFVFYPANLYPHKDHETLLNAVRLLRDRGSDIELVMTGHPANPGIEIERLIEQTGLVGAAHWLGHVDGPSLRYLYSRALALCFPSRFEGFGMPLVEAMQCDCPIVATARASIPEITGPAALLVEPTAEGFAQAIERLIDLPTERERLIALGRTRVDAFTPQAMAGATLAAFDEAIERFHQAAETRIGASYVIQPTRGSAALVDTLTSVAFEARPTDEILVIGHPTTFSESVRTLCDNIGHCRWIEPAGHGDWIDSVRRDVVCVLREGERLCQGAAGAARTAFAECEETLAVVGESIASDCDKQLTSLQFVADTPQALLVNPPPSATVFWKRDLLAPKRDLLEKSLWPAWILLATPPDRVRTVCRTFATVSPSMASWLGRIVAFAWRVHETRALRVKHLPRVTTFQLARGLAAGWVQRHKPRLRAWLSVLSPTAESRLKALYSTRVRGYLNRG